MNLSQVEYHDLRADRAELARAGASGLYHVCGGCGLCELAGGYCSSCRTGAYDLTAHLHAKGQPCPLTPASDSTTPAVLGIYHHHPGASRRRFPVALRPPSEATLAALSKARPERAGVSNKAVLPNAGTTDAVSRLPAGPDETPAQLALGFPPLGR